MQITDIKEQTKDTSRVSVFVDNKFAFGISKNSFVKLNLSIGANLTKEELDSYKEDAKDSKLIDLAYKWALRRPHSIREINDYIRRKTDDEGVAAKIYNALDSAGFVDDKKFAQAWVESRRKKGYSTFQIRGELMKKGITDQLLKSAVDDADDVSSLKLLAEKKHRLTSYKDKNKLKAYLLRKGYRYSDITKIIEELT